MDEAYTIYKAAMERQGILVEENFEDLDQKDQAAWGAVEYYFADKLQRENAELQARIGRLEQALETIRDWPHHLPIEAAQDIARCALIQNHIEREAEENEDE